MTDFAEIFLILLLALIVLGPGAMPGAASKPGRFDPWRRFGQAREPWKDPGPRSWQPRPPGRIEAWFNKGFDRLAAWFNALYHRLGL